MRSGSDLKRNGSVEERILDAARECFFSLGASKTSMADVATVARVSRGSVYKYFSTKNILVERVQSAAIDEDIGRLRRAMDKEESLAGQLAVAAATACRLAKAGRKQYARSTVYSSAALFILESPAAIARMIEMLIPYLSAAVERGEARASIDIPRTAEWIACMMIALATLRSGDSEVDCSDVGRFYAEQVLRGIQ